MEAPAPTSMSELKAFLGLINYYGKFLSNLATTLAPLYKLLQKNVKWSWGAIEKSAFEQIKKQLTSDSLIVHYDPNAELVLSCDASPYRVGAVLSHHWSEGTERPIAFASRTLAPAECHYAHLDKEALAIIFGLKHFNQYLAGHHFVIFRIINHSCICLVLQNQHQQWLRHTFSSGPSCLAVMIMKSNTDQDHNRPMQMHVANYLCRQVFRIFQHQLKQF